MSWISVSVIWLVKNNCGASIITIIPEIKLRKMWQIVFANMTKLIHHLQSLWFNFSHGLVKKNLTKIAIHLILNDNTCRVALLENCNTYQFGKYFDSITIGDKRMFYIIHHKKNCFLFNAKRSREVRLLKSFRLLCVLWFEENWKRNGRKARRKSRKRKIVLLKCGKCLI